MAIVVRFLNVTRHILHLIYRYCFAFVFYMYQFGFAFHFCIALFSWRVCDLNMQCETMLLGSFLYTVII